MASELKICACGEPTRFEKCRLCVSEEGMFSAKLQPAAEPKHSREWFAAKVKEAADRIDTYPEHIKAGMVWATATLPTLPATTHPTKDTKQ